MQRLINAEIKRGIIDKYYLFLGVIILASILTILFCSNSCDIMNRNNYEGRISFMDCVIHLFRGMEEYNSDSKNAFEVVDSFMIWNLILAIIVGSYPVHDLLGLGQHILVLSLSRCKWWFSKVIWLVITIILFYVSIFVGVLIGIGFSWFIAPDKVTLIGGVNPFIFSRIFEKSYEPNMFNKLVVFTTVVPVIASLGIHMLQMFLEYLTNSIIGYISVISFMVISAYYMRFYLLGNALMVYRSNIINPNGVGVKETIIVSLSIILLLVILGYFVFIKKDFYKK